MLSDSECEENYDSGSDNGQTSLMRTGASSSLCESPCSDECCNNLTAPYHSVDVISSKKGMENKVVPFKKHGFQIINGYHTVRRKTQ